MVTVIIPALNEEEHIGYVVDFARQHPLVSEVLVVDDKSLDNTVAIARAHGARVITSTRLGKGISMREGVLCAVNEILVFLDADIEPYPAGTIDALLAPILSGEADFTKSKFNRNAGRVTELVAKPLMSIFFPELLEFEQPLSGMIAGKKSAFRQIEFNDDYGVDVGILIDLHKLKVPSRQVEIGYIENKSKPWEALGKMSKEVARTILQKAGYPLPSASEEDPSLLSQIRSQLEFAAEDKLSTLRKLVVFDLDNTLIKGCFMDYFAGAHNLIDQLNQIRRSEKNPIVKAKMIAQLLLGKSIHEIIQVVDHIPIVSGAVEVIAELREKGYMVGIISDGFDFIANHIKNKLGLDFAIANELEFSNSVCTGEVRIPSYFLKGPESVCGHLYCQTNAMLRVLEKFDISKEDALSIGQSRHYSCLLAESGNGPELKARLIKGKSAKGPKDQKEG
ncbi:MAG TPA: HAD-IB family phosphatase [Saprospiraceae bacterium]|nr:HAD-IB family phosphatase [Saprospiraceae bacterium]HNT22680.1 HAD-IB family phosphatase [Saprospiraceae bacterium]